MSSRRKGLSIYRKGLSSYRKDQESRICGDKNRECIAVIQEEEADGQHERENAYRRTLSSGRSGNCRRADEKAVAPLRL